MTMSEQKQVYASFRPCHGFSDAPSLVTAITVLMDKFGEGKKALICGEEFIAGQPGRVALNNMVGPDGEEVVVLIIKSDK
jgi:hypothetical protein